MRAPRLIAIGASAGGIAAVNQLLQPLPPNLRQSIVIVLHLPAGNESLLAPLFGRHTCLPVHEAGDKMALLAGQVYVGPPDYHLQVEADATLSLSVDEPVNFSRPSIDVLFESAAAAIGPELLAIVLTGGNADGAAGLATVRRAGGQAWVQRPDSAQAPEMPQAALSCAGADLVLTPSEIGEALRRLNDQINDDPTDSPVKPRP